MIIAICGSSGSGKTYISKQLKIYLETKFPSYSILLLSMDNFYKGKSQYNKTQKKQLKNNTLNYDLPDMIDINAFRKVIYDIQCKKPFVIPKYDFVTYDRDAQNREYDSNYDIVIIEGIFTFYYHYLYKLFNYCIYVDTPLDMCFNRRLSRNLVLRCNKKMDEEKEISYYNTYVLPSDKLYIKPYKNNADIIIKNDVDFVTDIFSPINDYIKLLINK